MNKAVTMGPDDIPFGERTNVRPALPDYDSAKALDTEHFRKDKKLFDDQPERETHKI